MFTSTLSVSEFAVLTDLRAVPLRQVMGVSVQQIGWQYLPPEARWGGDELFCELDRIGHAWDQARRQALDRMTEEARAAGADAVVGVHLTRGEHDLGARTVDFIVTGMAIRTGIAEPPAWPALTDLSAQDYWLLDSAGWAAAGFVAATAVYFISQGFQTRWRRRTSFASNQELTEFSDAFSNARHAAVRYLRSQAEAAGGDGIVGVTLEHSVGEGKFQVYQSGMQRSTGLRSTTLAMGATPPAQGGSDERSGLVITIQAAGTAIRRRAEVARYPPERTLAAAG
jgi:uncharacterized protein YbjQ (UPF0145 family)